MKKIKNASQGFTLLELLVVVMIIGILAAIALPQYNKAVWKSRFIQAKTLVKSIANSEEVYYTLHGKYTKDFKALDIDITPNKYENSNSHAYFDWGYCMLNSYSNRHEVHCIIYKNNKDYLRYLLELANGTYFSEGGYGKARCIAYGTTSQPSSADVNYQVCQNETNDKNPQGFGSESLSFRYK